MVKMAKYKIGYTQGVFDMFHVGHLNLLINAKEQCDFLIVGVNSDALVSSYKNRIPIINENDRMKIVGNIKCVDKVILADTLDKNRFLKELGFDVIFIGNDWKGNERWNKTVEEMKASGVDVVFLPHTDGVNSAMLRDQVSDKINDE